MVGGSHFPTQTMIILFFYLSAHLSTLGHHTNLWLYL